MGRNLFFTSDWPRSVFTFLHLYTRLNSRNSRRNSGKDFFFHQFKGGLSLNCFFLSGICFLELNLHFNGVLDLQVSKISFRKVTKYKGQEYWPCLWSLLARGKQVPFIITIVLRHAKLQKIAPKEALINVKEALIKIMLALF